jgi:hypothetical protein
MWYDESSNGIFEDIHLLGQLVSDQNLDRVPPECKSRVSAVPFYLVYNMMEY